MKKAQQVNQGNANYNTMRSIIYPPQWLKFKTLTKLNINKEDVEQLEYSYIIRMYF